MSNEIIPFTTPEELGKHLEELVELYDISYIEASILFAERTEIEEEVLGSLIKNNHNLTAKIHHEAMKLNFIQKERILEF